MNRKSSKTWYTALKTTFTIDGIHLHTLLGNWCKNNSLSQNWTNYKDKEDKLYMTPI